MDKKIVIKLQKIVPSIREQTQIISNAIELNADNKEIEERRGSLFIVYEIKSSQKMDKDLVLKIVEDVIHENYFLSENPSPIQAIEKSIIMLRDKLTKIIDGQVEYSIATTIIWGTTIYFVQYGNTKIQLMRGNKINPFSTVSEGRFSVASGTIEENDIIVLQTEEFNKIFPFDVLFKKSSIAQEELKSSQSCLILKIQIEKRYSEDERVNFNQNELGANNFKNKLSTNTNSSNIQKTPSLNNKYIIFFSVIVSVVLIIAFLINIYNKDKSVPETGINQNITPPAQAVNNPSTPVIDTSQDIERKIIRTNPTILYDMALIDNFPNAISVDRVNDYLVVADNTGSIYISDSDEIRFNKLKVTFPGLKQIFETNQNLAIIDEEGLKIYDLAQEKIIDAFNEELEVSTIYLNNIYAVNGNDINKYTKTGLTYQQEVWTTNPVLEGAKFVGIDASIYIMNTQGNLLRFTQGEQDEFEISGMRLKQITPADFLLNENLVYGYILDRYDRRIIVINKQGELRKQIKLVNEYDWDNLIDFDISQDEKTAYVLNGTILYEVSIEGEVNGAQDIVSPTEL